MRVNYNFAIDLEGNRYIEKGDYSTELKSGSFGTKPEIFADGSISTNQGPEVSAK